jgi:hypothetical protein
MGRSRTNRIRSGLPGRPGGLTSNGEREHDKADGELDKQSL